MMYCVGEGIEEADILTGCWCECKLRQPFIIGNLMVTIKMTDILRGTWAAQLGIQPLVSAQVMILSPPLGLDTQSRVCLNSLSAPPPSQK